jgi:hypothetical protein
MSQNNNKIITAEYNRKSRRAKRKVNQMKYVNIDGTNIPLELYPIFERKVYNGRKEIFDYDEVTNFSSIRVLQSNGVGQESTTRGIGLMAGTYMSL